MNLKFSILSILIFCTGSTAILADEYQRGFSTSRTCTRNEYREEYIPGTRMDPGYVKKWEETVEVPCPGANSTSRNETRNETRNVTRNEELDNNDCTEGKIAGGILGGGIATAISRGKDRWWAIPAGVIGGSMVGCDIDGG
tara:strand:- start:96 stop:518 length:423 start_codon:yes stop_codon:yes gene_type:complete